MQKPYRIQGVDNCISDNNLALRTPTYLTNINPKIISAVQVTELFKLINGKRCGLKIHSLKSICFK
jgi:hypothetical protein